jgi:hypothetical protein
MGGKVTPRPTPVPAGTTGADVGTKPYFMGWQAPSLGISGDNLILLGVVGLVVFLLVIGLIGYIGVRRRLQGPDDEDEYEDED